MLFMISLIILFLFLFAILAWKKPRWAIFIILAAIPSYAVRFNIGNIPMTLLEGMIIVLFILWLVRKINYNLDSRNESTDYILNFKFQILNSKKNQKSKIKSLSRVMPRDQKSKTISNIKIIFPILLFLTAATISVFISQNKLSALGIWKAYFIEPVLFLIVFIDYYSNNKDEAAPCHCNRTFNFIASALSIPALYISLFAIYQKFTGFLVPAEYWQPNYHRVTSFFSYPNAIGLLLAPITVILLGTAILTVKDILSIQQRIYFFTVALLSVAAIIFAKSEGAIIALIAGAFIFALLFNKKSRITAGIIIFLILSTGTGVYFKYGKVWNELFAKTNLFELDNACDNSPCVICQKLTLQDLSGTLRRQMWQETFTMLKSHPIFGAGLAGYQETMKLYHTKNYVEIYLYPHNIILNFWSETGLLGLIAFIWIIILFFISTFPLLCKSPALNEAEWEGLEVISLTLITAMSVLLIHGLADVPYFKNDLAILFWIIFGMMIISNLENKKTIS